MTRSTIDPITLTVVWNTLISIADELGVTLRNTAFSEGVREGDDFSTAIFNRDAVMIAQGNFSPGHLGSMPAVAKTVLQYFPPESLRPGDSILVNDSFIGAGHFPDTYEIMPVFLEGRIVGFVACSAHQVDMGGAAPGSQKVHGVTEAFQEGLRILPVRFVREGRIDEDILRIVLGNVRMPDKVRGDLLAQHTANLTASVRLATMFRDYGVETVERTYAAILDRSEQTMRDALAKVPAGTYSFEDRMDDYGPGTPPIQMAVDITFDGKGEVEFDFSRSSDTVPAAINSYINYTRAYAVFAIKAFCNALDPQTEGSMRPIKLKVREGSFFNPKFPAPSDGLAQGADVGGDAVVFLRAAIGDAEAGDDLVEDQQETVLLRELAQALEETGPGRDQALWSGSTMMPASSALCSRIRLATVSRSLNGATRTSSRTLLGMPAESGIGWAARASTTSRRHTVTKMCAPPWMRSPAQLVK